MGLGSGAFGLSQGQTADLSKRLGFLEQSVGSLLEGFSQGNDRVKELRAAQEFCSASFIFHSGMQNLASCQMDSKL